MNVAKPILYTTLALLAAGSSPKYVEAQASFPDGILLQCRNTDQIAKRGAIYRNDGHKQSLFFADGPGDRGIYFFDYNLDGKVDDILFVQDLFSGMKKLRFYHGTASMDDYLSRYEYYRSLDASAPHPPIDKLRSERLKMKESDYGTISTNWDFVVIDQPELREVFDAGSILLQKKCGAIKGHAQDFLSVIEKLESVLKQK